LPTARRRFHSGVCANAAGLIGKIRSLLKKLRSERGFSVWTIAYIVCECAAHKRKNWDKGWQFSDERGNFHGLYCFRSASAFLLMRLIVLVHILCLLSLLENNSRFSPLRWMATATLQILKKFVCTPWVCGGGGGKWDSLSV
jgi:hypothetical protein